MQWVTQTFAKEKIYKYCTIVGEAGAKEYIHTLSKQSMKEWYMTDIFDQITSKYIIYTSNEELAMTRINWNL